MKLEIYQEKPKKVKDTTVRLAFVQYGNEIVICAVDKNGDRIYRGNLMRFCDDGTIHHCLNVNPSFGFQLNDDGKIKEH